MLEHWTQNNHEYFTHNKIRDGGDTVKTNNRIPKPLDQECRVDS